MTIRLFSDPVRILSIGRNPIQVLSIRSDPVRFCQSDPIRSDPIRSDPIRSDPGFVNTHRFAHLPTGGTAPNIFITYS